MRFIGEVRELCLVWLMVVASGVSMSRVWGLCGVWAVGCGVFAAAGASEEARAAGPSITPGPRSAGPLLQLASCGAACLCACAAGGTAPPLEASEDAARLSAGTVATPGTAGRFKGPEPELPSDWPLACDNSLAKQKEGSWERGTWRMLTSMPACRWSHPFTCSPRSAPHHT
jgi:hypothetical protein